MTAMAEVVVVGAGPYGLSVAAHLTSLGFHPLVFGRSMESWRNGMPRGMRLKSEGFASSLSEPEGRFTLKAFCEAEKLPYANINYPTPVETFVAYGDAFQKRFVPQLDSRLVRKIQRLSQDFALELDDGAIVRARHVIVATGLSAFAHLPDPLQSLSPRRVTHTATLADYSHFSGARVLVVGAGSSATDAAAELLREGAEVTLACRAPRLQFYPGGSPRRWYDAAIAPMTPVGPGWRKWIVTRFPRLFWRLPERARVAIVNRTLGPAPAWFVRREIEGKIDVLSGVEIIACSETAAGVEIELGRRKGSPTTSVFDHVVSGSGYRVDVERLAFLDAGIVKALALVRQAPKLSADFESSVPGLYFVGVSAAYQFGPLLRFVCGADFAARRVSAAVAASGLRSRGLQAPPNACDETLEGPARAAGRRSATPERHTTAISADQRSAGSRR